MMKNEYLEYIVLLEKTLASFYNKIKDKAELSRIRTVLEFMETHSDGHSDAISEMAGENPVPEMDSAEILEYQNKLTKNSEEFLTKEKDLIKILDNLSHTEESLGDFYKRISLKLQELSRHYAKISEIIDKLGDDEYNHRDILLKDKERLMSKDDV